MGNGLAFTPEDRIKQYEHYLKNQLNMPCSDNGIWSHWGANAHRVELRWNQEDWERTHPKKKPKVESINQWLKVNHPEILKEYRKEVTNA